MIAAKNCHWSVYAQFVTGSGRLIRDSSEERYKNKVQLTLYNTYKKTRQYCGFFHY